MSITDDIVKNAQARNDNGAEILTFRDNDRVPYRAFGVNPTKEPLLRMRIYANQMLLMPKYDLLYDVPHTGIGDFVGLVYAHMTVKLFGRNLQRLVEGLETHSVEWIQQYSPPIWEYADGENGMLLPCIEKIVLENVPMHPQKEAMAWLKEREAQE